WTLELNQPAERVPAGTPHSGDFHTEPKPASIDNKLHRDADHQRRFEDMTEKKVWFITGAGRGMGVDITKAALAAGNAVVATGRNTDRIRSVLGEADDLLVVKLDITDPADAQAAAQAAVERFGRIDVLVNNAANFYGGFFEEIGPEQFRWQIETN